MSFANTRLLKSWDETTLTPLAVSNGKSTIPYTSIPAYSHILVINSNISSDHPLEFDTYNDIFPLTATGLPKSINKTFSPKVIEVSSDIIPISNLPEDMKTTISIYNPKGEMMTSTKPETSTKSIKINNLKHGIYIVKIAIGAHIYSSKFHK